MSDLQSKRQRLIDVLVALPAERRLHTTRARVLHVMEQLADDPELAAAMIYLVTNTQDPDAHPALWPRAEALSQSMVGDFPRRAAYHAPDEQQ